MLHLLSPIVLRLGPHAPQLPGKAEAWVREQLQQYEAAENDKLARKYHRLVSYLQAFRETRSEERA